MLPLPEALVSLPDTTMHHIGIEPDAHLPDALPTQHTPINDLPSLTDALAVIDPQKQEGAVACFAAVLNWRARYDFHGLVGRPVIQVKAEVINLLQHTYGLNFGSYASQSNTWSLAFNKVDSIIRQKQGRAGHWFIRERRVQS
jgi:hypothetical protein